MSLALIGHLRDFGKCSKFYISGLVLQLNKKIVKLDLCIKMRNSLMEMVGAFCLNRASASI